AMNSLQWDGLSVRLPKSAPQNGLRVRSTEGSLRLRSSLVISIGLWRECGRGREKSGNKE
ncbi:MAG: hypothetical protein Q8916_15015, partial [Bacteroidota bacterium]|nr:hypothetical protein [Bacteroidota bacterium]